MKHFDGSTTSGIHEGYTAVLRLDERPGGASALRAAAVQRQESFAISLPIRGCYHASMKQRTLPSDIQFRSVPTAPSMPVPKKAIERHYFDRFQTLLQPFPDGAITSTEEPDFLVVGSASTIGIELTELHRDSPAGQVPPQATEAMKRRVAARAEKLYAEAGHPPVRCTILMHDQHIQRAEVEPLATAIVGIAVRNMPLPNSSTHEAFDWANRHYFPEIINRVNLHRLDVITENHFTCPGATWVPGLSSSDIERALAAKEGKYTTYRQRCDDAWLLINADIGSMSTWFDFDEDAIAGPFNTSFNRAFVMLHFGQTLHELAIVRPRGV